MKAAQLFGPGDLRVVDIPMPIPGPEDVLLRVARFAPYGTDVGTFLNRGGRYGSNYPFGIGADFSGTVEAIGKDVRNVAVGDRVSALAMDHCGTCRNCRRGLTNLCLDSARLNAPRQVCCQTHTLVRANKLARLPQGVTFDDAAMLSGLVTVMNGLEMLDPAVDETVGIVGAGAMGWSAIAAARAMGRTMIVLGGARKRAQIARDLGADRLLEITAYDDDLASRLKETVPGGLPCVIETTATDWGLKQAFAIAGLGGRLALLGGSAAPATGWDLVARQLTVHGVRAGHHQEMVLDLIAAGRIDLKPTITHRFSLDDSPRAFALLTGADPEAVGRVMIEIDPAA